MLFYWLPFIISVICEMSISYIYRARTIRELFSIFSILAFIPLMNIFTAFAGLLMLIEWFCRYVGSKDLNN